MDEITRTYNWFYQYFHIIEIEWNKNHLIGWKFAEDGKCELLSREDIYLPLMQKLINALWRYLKFIEKGIFPTYNFWTETVWGYNWLKECFEGNERFFEDFELHYKETISQYLDKNHTDELLKDLLFAAADCIDEYYLSAS